MSKSVTIIDYGLGNLFSVVRAFRYLGCNTVVTDDPKMVSKAEYLILPGVGSFGEGIANLEDRGLVEPIRIFSLSGRPFLGICLGMQLLMNFSEELGLHRGLEIVKGKVVRLSVMEEGGRRYKVPHIGWNRLEKFNEDTVWERTILDGVESGVFVYFVHSYNVVLDNPHNIVALTRYGSNRYCSLVRAGNIYGSQFHPEKSGIIGLRILKNFLDLT